MTLLTRHSVNLCSLLFVLVCSIYACAFWLWPKPTHDLQHVADHINQAWQEQDAISIRPWWASRIRKYLGDKPCLHHRDLSRVRLDYKRLWVISFPGYELSEHRPFLNPTGKRLADMTKRVDTVSIELYQLPMTGEIVFDFRKNLTQAAVAIQKGNNRHPCEWRSRRFRCSRHVWNYVGQTIMQVDQAARYAIWAHPTQEGPLIIDYHSVPQADTLRIETGLSQEAAQTPDGTPIQLEIAVDGKVVGNIIHPNTNKWLEHRIDLGNSASLAEHHIRFRISSKRAGMRHFCFAAKLLKTESVIP